MAQPWILDYDPANCAVAATVSIIGEKWTFLVLREAFSGVRRFADIQRRTQAPRQILSDRLSRLVHEDLLRRVPYQEAGQRSRHEYRLTEKGLDLWPTVVALLQWGDKHQPVAAGPPVLLEHRDCGGAVDDHRLCERCGARLGPRDVVAKAGPGARPDHPLRLREARQSAAA
jgi:DNA-binding HxlR family transcriptional regulator